MTETARLIATIKKQLKNQGIPYRELARALEISEASVKRILSSGRLTIDRLIQIGNVLGYTLSEISKEAAEKQPQLQTLTEKQEREVVSNPTLLIVAVCSVNHWSVEEIVGHYRMTKAECIKCLLQLDKLRIIDLLPNNRIRLNVAHNFDWLPLGPINQYFQSLGMKDFMGSHFSREDETMTFVHGMYTDQAIAQIQNELRRLRQKFAELHEDSLLAPLSKRSAVGLLLALRKWEPDAFKKMRRR